MSADTPEDLRKQWESCRGSQKGQYRLSHAKVGVLLARISDLEADLERATQRDELVERVETLQTEVAHLREANQVLQQRDDYVTGCLV